jgi:S-adenosylmethionine:tRNA ribosyltransferase-isomerase
LRELAAGGVQTADLTLHVGLGTFRPITADQIEDHVIHREVYEISRSSQNALFETSGRRVAIGTTSVRTIEDFLSKHSSPLGHDCADEAGIFIYPPRNFSGVDALITNFHQPRSTLLCLVSAFLTPGSVDGIAWLKEIYAEAIAREYRFFSYGDAMLLTTQSR